MKLQKLRNEVAGFILSQLLWINLRTQIKAFHQSQKERIQGRIILLPMLINSPDTGKVSIHQNARPILDSFVFEDKANCLGHPVRLEDYSIAQGSIITEIENLAEVMEIASQCALCKG